MTPQETETYTEGRPSEPGHRQIQAAHEGYFQNLALTWAAAQSRFQTIQMEFERALERAWQAQDPNAYQKATTDYQNAIQSACMDTSQPGPYNDAYMQYKAAMQKAIAAANLEDMSFTDIAHISQSLAMVWPIAMMLSQGTMTMAARQ